MVLFQKDGYEVGWSPYRAGYAYEDIDPRNVDGLGEFPQLYLLCNINNACQWLFVCTFNAFHILMIEHLP